MGGNITGSGAVQEASEEWEGREVRVGERPGLEERGHRKTGRLDRKVEGGAGAELALCSSAAHEAPGPTSSTG